MKTIKPGQIGLYPSCRPPLSVGAYTLKIEQTLTRNENTTVSGEEAKVAAAEQEMKIAGPRFVLVPDEIHSMFPPANDCGNFSNRLPQIVLRRRTLPWERTIDGTDEGPSWMALILVHENEDVAGPEPMLVDDLLRGSGLVSVPILQGVTAKEKMQTCSVVHIPGKMFTEICPSKEEVDLLAHVRVVSTEDKELLGQDEDGWFSVVTGHRFPDKDESKADGLVHRALLVSLEGHSHNLDMVGNKMVRLVVLASWAFTSKSEGDFQTTLTSIGQHGGVGLLGDHRRNCVAKGIGGEDRNGLILETAHVPLNQSYRTGEQGVGLYRGPLVPAPIVYKSMICHHADEAMVVDPITGLEHLGYAAAFEVGRLLGSSDEFLAVGLMKWRRGDYDDGQGKADIADMVVDLQIPELREDDLFGPGGFRDLMDPLGPLINPAQDFISRPGNIMDLCGMSPDYAQQQFATMVTDIADFAHVDREVAMGRVREEGVFVEETITEVGTYKVEGFEDLVGREMGRERAHRNLEIRQAMHDAAQVKEVQR